MRRSLQLAIIVISSLISGDHLQACSGFFIARDSTIYAGKNTDLTDWKSKIWFVPPTDSTFGYVSLGFRYPELSDGMNDQGLVVSHFSGHEKEIKKSIHKPVYHGILSELVLATCASIEDVKRLLDKYNLGLFHNGMIMYSDKSGHSMIVEGDTIIEKKHFYQICTNTYQSECDEDTHPYWKEVPAEQSIPAAKEITRSFCQRTLESMQDDMTQYSIIYDVNHLKFSIFLFHDFTNRVDFDLARRLKNGRQIFDLFTFFPKDSRYYQVYIKRQSPQNNLFILLLLIACGLILSYTIIVWPSAYFLRVIESREKNEPRHQIDSTKFYSFLICILLTSYLIVLMNFKEAFQIGLPSQLDNFPLLIKLVVHIPFLVVFLIFPLIIMNYKTLRNPNRSRSAKWHLTLNTLAYLVLSGLFFYWGFVR